MKVIEVKICRLSDAYKCRSRFINLMHYLLTLLRTQLHLLIYRISSSYINSIKQNFLQIQLNSFMH